MRRVNVAQSRNIVNSWDFDSSNRTTRCSHRTETTDNNICRCCLCVLSLLHGVECYRCCFPFTFGLNDCCRRRRRCRTLHTYDANEFIRKVFDFLLSQFHREHHSWRRTTHERNYFTLALRKSSWTCTFFWAAQINSFISFIRKYSKFLILRMEWTEFQLSFFLNVEWNCAEETILNWSKIRSCTGRVGNVAAKNPIHTGKITRN